MFATLATSALPLATSTLPSLATIPFALNLSQKKKVISKGQPTLANCWLQFTIFIFIVMMMVGVLLFRGMSPLVLLILTGIAGLIAFILYNIFMRVFGKDGICPWGHKFDYHKKIEDLK